MAWSAVASALTRIGDLLTEEATYLWGVKEQVNRLQRELEWMQSFLIDADAKQDESKRVRRWVSEIRDLAYDAEDVVETYALKIGSKRKGDFSNCIKRSTCILKEGWMLHKTRSEIEKIIARITDLTRQLRTYGIRELRVGEGSSSANERLELRRSYPHIIEDYVVGFDSDIKKLASVLVDKESDFRVVTICGMGGLGKTTLAKKVYHHSQIKGHFNHLAWVYVSQHCQRRKVWEDILSGLISSNERGSKLSDEELAEKLFNFLKDKRCLVILDDVWSTEAWDSIKAGFPMKETSSKILLTSRNKEVASHADRRSHLHELQCLNYEQSWELFQKISFTDYRVDARMEELGKDMVKHCSGLPLAIVVLGGILATKNSLIEWQMVFENVKLHLKRGKGQGPEDVLALSYDDLPPYLKPCFLYLGLFPEDYEIHAHRLIQLWAAEGIVSSKQGGDESETIEDVAERYLIELVERCMIQVRQRNVATLKIKSFQMHDLMRDLCLSKAKQENFLFVVDQSNANSLSIFQEARRVSAHQSPWIRHMKGPNLRSLLFFVGPYMSEEIWMCMIHNFKLLRVLHFDRGPIVEVRELPSVIGNLIYLKFFSLKNHYFGKSKLPSSLGNLRCLRTLDLRLLRGVGAIHVPDVIWRMEQLRHLYLPYCFKDRTKLKLGTLRNLQTLVNFNTENCYVKDLINMTNIRKLKIREPFNIEDFNEEDLDKNPPIIKSKYLHSLSIVNRDHYRKTLDPRPLTHLLSTLDPRHLAHLLSNCVSTCKLSLATKVTKLPEYHCFSSNIAYIHLDWCQLEEDPMPTLEKLPNLRILKLEFTAINSIVKELVCSAEGFPKLYSLSLIGPYELEEWKVDEGAMPALCLLEIMGCWSLKMLPDGLKFLATLQELRIVFMPKAFTDKVVEGGEDFYKVQHVPSIIFQNCQK